MPAEAPVSANFTGTVLPSLKIELPPGSIGWRMPHHDTTTVSTNVPVAVLPCASCAEQLTVVGPSGKAEPDGGVHVTGTGPSTRSFALAVYVPIVPVTLVAV